MKNSEKYISISNSIETLMEFSRDFSRLANDTDILFKEIKRRGAENCERILDEIEDYGSFGSVTILRYVIAQMLLDKKIETLEGLEKTIEAIKFQFSKKYKQESLHYESIFSENPKELNQHKDSYDYENFDLEKYFNRPKVQKRKDKILEYVYTYNKSDAFRNWTRIYNLLFIFIYDKKTQELVYRHLENIIDGLLEFLGIKDEYECIRRHDFVYKVHSYFGFEGPKYNGGTRACLMLHPKAIPDHKNSFQLVCYFKDGIVEYGVDSGSNVDKDFRLKNNFKQRIKETHPNQSASDIFEAIIKYLKSELPDVKEYNNKYLKYKPEIKQEFANEMIADTKSADASDRDLPDSDRDNNDSNNGGIGNLPPNDGSNGEDSQDDDNYGIASNIERHEDHLNRTKLAKYLANLITNRRVQALNIGIYGKWGSGKTQVAHLIRKYLKESKESLTYCDIYDTRIVDFDAWQYDDQDKIWAALIIALLEECKKTGIFHFKYLFNRTIKWFNNLGNILKITALFAIFCAITHAIGVLDLKWWSIIDVLAKFEFFMPHLFLATIGTILLASIIFAAAPTLIKFPILNINENFMSYLECPTYQNHLGFRKDIEDITRLAIDHLTVKGDRRAIIFIDNLDRCSSKNIRQILDSICQFLEMCKPRNKKNNRKFVDEKANLMAIFMVNKEILEQALKDGFVDEKNADDYLHKMINLPVHLPLENLTELLKRLSYDERATEIITDKELKLTGRQVANKRYLLNMYQEVYSEQGQLTNDEIEKILRIE